MNTSTVDLHFSKQMENRKISTKIPYLLANNLPQMGLLTSLRFLEWAAENPEGTISLPTGKTPEHFIRYTQYLLANWSDKKSMEIRGRYGLEKLKKPDLHGLQFVQMDEFYPIPSSQHNSFCNYVEHFYIKGFGLDPKKAALINSDKIGLPGGNHFLEVFPNYQIDLSLRYREATSPKEKQQQQAIICIDNWCTRYEEQIREKGGIGFFLGGIGPDGHIAFNPRGADHYSTTRLTATNFETQAAAAGDLGGIEISRHRLVITIGLGTITYNPNTVALIFAAGEAKAGIVRDALENEPSNAYPGTALQKLPNCRFYLTTGAASKLTDSIDNYYMQGEWTHAKTERAVIDLCKKVNKFGPRLSMDDLKTDRYCQMIPGLNEQTVQSVIDSITKKMEKGMEKERNQIFYHTGPHHDDIMLGMMPHINRQLRESSNEFHFSVLTSGFTAVTNHFAAILLQETKRFLQEERIQMVKYPDFFSHGYQYKWDKDIYHFLDHVASSNPEERMRGICHRVVRAIVSIWKIKNEETLRDTINDILSQLRNSYDGSKNPPKIQTLKGMIREMEEELVWAHYGVPVRNVHHLRLGFYQGGIFTDQPRPDRDVLPILEEFRKYKPTVISLATDPEGSGPDTHYKVLQTIASALTEWAKEEDLAQLRIIGYRNVWFRYHPADVEVIVPVSLNSLAILDHSFTACYLSQVNAPFPSYQYDGKFSQFTQKVWVEQHQQIQYLLGKDYFYQHEKPLVRATHGLVYFREMSVPEFLSEAQKLEDSMAELIF